MARNGWLPKSHVYARGNTVAFVCFITLMLTSIAMMIADRRRDEPFGLLSVVPMVAAVLVNLSHVVWFRRVRWHARSLGCLLCKYCRYDLRQIQEPGRCPECGEAFDAKSLKEYWDQP